MAKQSKLALEVVGVAHAHLNIAHPEHENMTGKTYAPLVTRHILRQAQTRAQKSIVLKSIGRRPVRTFRHHILPIGNSCLVYTR